MLMRREWYKKGMGRYRWEPSEQTLRSHLGGVRHNSLMTYNPKGRREFAEFMHLNRQFERPPHSAPLFFQMRKVQQTMSLFNLITRNYE